MDSGRGAPPGDMLQVIPRRSPSLGFADATGSVSVRIRLAPARRRKLTRVVVAAVAACTLILIAAGIAHLARATNETAATAAPGNQPAATLPAPVAPAAAAAPVAPPADVPQTGTLRLQHPATAGKVWLDGQKIAAASATVTCGSHQVKVGAHGKAHAIDVPCGGELRLTR
jgi:hypothetical protein